MNLEFLIETNLMIRKEDLDPTRGLDKSQFFVKRMLQLIGAVFWTIAYVVLIKRAFTLKTWGMPFFANWFNITYEFYTLFSPSSSTFQRSVTFVWAVLDIFILGSYYMFADPKTDFPYLISSNLEQFGFDPFQSLVLLGVVCSISFWYLLEYLKTRFQDVRCISSAFVLALFIGVEGIFTLWWNQNTCNALNYETIIMMMVGNLCYSFTFFHQPSWWPTVKYLSIIYTSVYLILAFQLYQSSCFLLDKQPLSFTEIIVSFIFVTITPVKNKLH